MTGFAPSGSEAKRLVLQGAVSLDGERVADVNLQVALDDSGRILKVGKRKFARVKRA